MLIGKDNVLSWLEFNKTPFWRIKSGSGENAGIIFTCQRGDENVALEDGKTRLASCLSQMAPGNYFIESWCTLDQKKGWNKTQFQLTNAEGNVPMHNNQYGGQHQNFSVSGLDVEARITAALEKERQLNKIERLEAELKVSQAKVRELETELSATELKIGKRMDQILGPLLDLQIPAANNNASVGNLEADAERIATSMEKWASKDPDFETALTGIVDLAYNDPQKYALAKTMLKPKQ